MLAHLLKLLPKFGAVAWLPLCGSLVEVGSATRSSNSTWVMESMRGIWDLLGVSSPVVS